MRKMLAKFPSLEQLKAIYMDEKAIAAGASGSKWYTALALAAREHVRMSDEVAEACQLAWVSVMQAAHHQAGSDESGVDAAGTASRAALQAGLTREAYEAMSRKLYLLSKLLDGDVNIDAADCRASAEEDWREDAGSAKA